MRSMRCPQCGAGASSEASDCRADVLVTKVIKKKYELKERKCGAASIVSSREERDTALDMVKSSF
jgi:hypothetical protein